MDKTIEEHVCYVCGTQKGIAESVLGDIIVDEKKGVILFGEIFNRNYEIISLCKFCMASFFFSMADSFYEQSKGKPVYFH